MTNIKTVILDKYLDAAAYEAVGDGVYKRLSDGNFVVTLSFRLEDEEDTQYPLEDILDLYYINCTGHMEESEQDGDEVLEVELEGSLDPEKNLANIRRAAALAGKHVYNKDEGDSVALVIE